MARRYLAPNPENASLADLRSARKAGNRETDRRCLVIIMLLVGSTREQVMKTVELTDDAIRKIIRAFNLYGVDGLIARKRPDGLLLSPENKRRRFSKTSKNRDGPREPSGPRLHSMAILLKSIRWNALTRPCGVSCTRRATS